MDLELFLAGYITAALWSTADDPDAGRGEMLDATFDRYDLSAGTLEAMREDCRTFIEANAADLALYAEQYTPASAEYTVDECAGHDFWLTRHHHGVGFWDRGLGALGDRLTVAAQAYPSFDLGANDDGKLYH